MRCWMLDAAQPGEDCVVCPHQFVFISLAPLSPPQPRLAIPRGFFFWFFFGNAVPPHPPTKSHSPSHSRPTQRRINPAFICFLPAVFHRVTMGNYSLSNGVHRGGQAAVRRHLVRGGEVLTNRSPYQLKPFSLSTETVLPIT